MHKGNDLRFSLQGGMLLDPEFLDWLQLAWGATSMGAAAEPPAPYVAPSAEEVLGMLRSAREKVAQQPMAGTDLVRCGETAEGLCALRQGLRGDPQPQDEVLHMLQCNYGAAVLDLCTPSVQPSAREEAAKAAGLESFSGLAAEALGGLRMAASADGVEGLCSAYNFARMVYELRASHEAAKEAWPYEAEASARKASDVLSLLLGAGSEHAVAALCCVSVIVNEQGRTREAVMLANKAEQDGDQKYVDSVLGPVLSEFDASRSSIRGQGTLVALDLEASGLEGKGPLGSLEALMVKDPATPGHPPHPNWGAGEHNRVGARWLTTETVLSACAPESPAEKYIRNFIGRKPLRINGEPLAPSADMTTLDKIRMHVERTGTYLFIEFEPPPETAASIIRRDAALVGSQFPYEMAQSCVQSPQHFGKGGTRFDT